MNSDWSAWFRKIRWQFISFKVQAFWVFSVCLVASWLHVVHIYKDTVKSAKELFSGGFITQEGVVQMITGAQKTLFETALNHILTFAGVILTGILAIKGFSYFTSSKQTTKVIEKMGDDVSMDDLKQFLPKG